MLRKSVRLVLAGFATATALLLALPATAQQEIVNAPASQEGAKGIPMGGFRLFPSIDLTASYDDNIYRTQTGAKSDYFFTETPAFLLQSQWSRHLLELYGNYADNEYITHGSEDNAGGTIGGDGRLDIVRGLDAIAGGSYNVLHLARTSPDQPFNASSPTRYSQTEANAALEYHPYHFNFSVGGNYTRWEYDPTRLFGTTPLSNADRDEDLYTGFAKAAYEFSPGYAAFVQANINDAVYDLKTDRSGFHRNNNGESYDAGIDMLVTNLVKGQIFVGYLDQHYKAPLVGISGFNWGANVDWTPDTLWALHLTASRTLNGTTIAGASAEDDETVRLGVDYLPTRTIKIFSHAAYTDGVFNGSPRNDKYFDAGVGVEYAMNPHMSARLSYDYQNRNSSIGGQNFDDNTFLVGLNFHI